MITPAAALRAQLDDIDKSMAALESQMTSLRAQKEQLLTDLDSLKYPVLTLPTEITVEIFLHFVTVMQQEFHRPQPYYGLLRLASVCQTWRAVTLSTCALWNDIAIWDSSRWIWILGFREDDSSKDMIMSILSLYGSQWRRINLSCESIEPISVFPTSHFPSSLPLLESFKLSDHEVNDDSTSSLRHAPHLRELNLCNSSRVIQLGLPFNKLTKLVWFGDSAELLAILPHALNLECLQLGFSTEYAQVAPLSILLPHLHTFMCRGATMVLHYLMLPALEQLQLQHHLSDAGVHAILSCVAQSCSTIRTLNIDKLAFDPAYYCLRSLPTIRHLCLSWIPWMDDEEDSFFAAIISGSCLPNLETLTWEHCRLHRAEQLFTVISARWWGVEGTTKLSTVSLDFSEGGDWDDDPMHDYENALDQLYELGRQGLKLVITGVPNTEI
ncbi:hypothetical protein GGX14DRAFT_648096, partial [Mycena pura]